jgi:hypothetical protein
MILLCETNFICTACDPLDRDYRVCQEILSLAKADGVEIHIPKMCDYEAHHVFKMRAEKRTNLFTNVKQLFWNGRSAGLDVATDFDMDVFDNSIGSLLDATLPSTETLDLIKRLVRFFEPSDQFHSALTSIRAASSTGQRERPFLLEELDGLIFASVLDYIRSSSRFNDNPRSSLFCSRDGDLIDGVEAILPILGIDLPVTDNFSVALSWAQGVSQ